MLGSVRAFSHALHAAKNTVPGVGLGSELLKQQQRDHGVDPCSRDAKRYLHLLRIFLFPFVSAYDHYAAQT